MHASINIMPTAINEYCPLVSIEQINSAVLYMECNIKRAIDEHHDEDVFNSVYSGKVYPLFTRAETSSRIPNFFGTKKWYILPAHIQYYEYAGPRSNRARISLLL